MFQSARKERETYDAAGKPISVVSITLPHFILANEEKTDCIRPQKKLFSPPDTHEKSAAPNSIEGNRCIMEVASSICITGDKFGEFWTCSLLGIRAFDDLSFGRVREILDAYWYDKISARHFIFIFWLAKVCDFVSQSYEEFLDELAELINLHVSSPLHSSINRPWQIHRLTCLVGF